MRRRLAIAVIGLVFVVAIAANFIASDRPILLRYQGQLYWFPNLIDYDDLEAVRGESLQASMTEDDWAVWPPVRHSSTAVRGLRGIEPLLSPSTSHWLGTDDRGRDVMARMVHGTRATLVVAVGASLLALALGLMLAVAAAAWRREAEVVLIAGCDAVSSIPALVLVVAAQGLIGRASLVAAVVLIALPRAADTARVAAAGLRTAMTAPFSLAALGVGATKPRVVVRHALPHAWPQLAVATALTAATAVLAEAALSFLGFGTPPPTASWGDLLKQAHENGLAWWLALPPGVAIACLAGAFGALAQPKVTTSV